MHISALWIAILRAVAAAFVPARRARPERDGAAAARRRMSLEPGADGVGEAACPHVFRLGRLSLSEPHHDRTQ